MASFSQFGNDLYTGARSIDFVGRRKLWYGIAALLIIVCAVVPFLRGGFNLGIDFTGGSEFRLNSVAVDDEAQSLGLEVIEETVPDSQPTVVVVGGDSLRFEAGLMTEPQVRETGEALAAAFSLDAEAVSSSFVGASWGQDVSRQALWALGIFLVLVSIVMALYFRTWKMSAAALIALLHDLIITIGVYGITGFEITPAAVIGVLTILGYSLYDSVVVFDKIRENTAPVLDDSDSTFENFRSKVNLAVNQTLVRSINTSVVAVLPVGAVLFIGAFVLGAGTLQDIALALFIGMLIGTYSTIFLAAPLYVHLREREPRWKRESVAD